MEVGLNHRTREDRPVFGSENPRPDPDGAMSNCERVKENGAALTPTSLSASTSTSISMAVSSIRAFQCVVCVVFFD